MTSTSRMLAHDKQHTTDLAIWLQDLQELATKSNLALLPARGIGGEISNACAADMKSAIEKRGQEKPMGYS